MITYDKTNFIQTIVVGFYNLVNNIHIWIFSLGFAGFAGLLAMALDVSDSDITNETAGIGSLVSALNLFLSFNITFKLSNAYNSWVNAYRCVDEFIGSMKQFLAILIAKRIARGDVIVARDLMMRYLSFVFFISYTANDGKDLTCKFIDMDDESLYNQFTERAFVTEDARMLENNLPNGIVGTKLDMELRRFVYGLGDRYEYVTSHDGNLLTSVINDLSRSAGSIYNMALIPIINLYNKFINVSILMNLTIFSVYLVIISGYYATIYVFAWSFTLFVVNEICNKISTPFGDDEDDLELGMIFKKTVLDVDIMIDDMIM